MSKKSMLPCPTCNSTEQLVVMKYDSGWRYVECLKCNYLGPGEGSITQAILSHNKKARWKAEKAEKQAEKR